jgi:hypothetical protein
LIKLLKQITTTSAVLFFWAVKNNKKEAGLWGKSTPTV